MMAMLTLFAGVMFGVNGAAQTITKLSTSAAQRASKAIARKVLTKGTIYPAIKRIARLSGIKMTKEIFAKAVSKAIPVIGGFASGVLTWSTYKPMAKKLKKHLETLPCADVNYYKGRTNGELADMEFNEGVVESICNDLDAEIVSEEKELSKPDKKYDTDVY